MTLPSVEGTKIKQNLYVVRMKAFVKYEKTCEKLKKTLFFCLENKLYSFFCKRISMSTTRISCCTIDLNVFYSNHLSELELHQCDTLVSHLPSIVSKK